MFLYTNNVNIMFYGRGNKFRGLAFTFNGSESECRYTDLA